MIWVHPATTDHEQQQKQKRAHTELRRAHIRLKNDIRVLGTEKGTYSAENRYQRPRKALMVKMAK